MSWTIHQGDCVEEMAKLEEGSVDAVVCDPPYGLSREPNIAEVLQHWLAGDDYEHRGGGFMGQSWDSFAPGPLVWREAFRVLKHITRRDGDDPGPTKNNHPTVKPISLMRWLVRLVTPPGGTCLDPFLGSGSTGCAAALEGFDFVGMEREPDYVAIAEARIAFWGQHEGREVEDVLGLYSKSQRQAKDHVDRGQVSIDDLLAEEAAA